MKKAETATIGADDMEVDAAWLHFVEGLTQAEIAERRGLSRMKVHRLIQMAREKGLVRFFVDRVPSDCLDIEARLMERYGLASCTVVPAVGKDMDSSVDVVGVAGARFLFGMLEPTTPRTIGIGSGRTIARVVHCLPALARPHTTFTSITGDFAELNEANPKEVVNALIRKTGGLGYALPAPLVANSRDDRDLFLRQRSVAATLQKAAKADFFLIGIGHLGKNSFWDKWNLVSGNEILELEKQQVIADVAGHLIDADGNLGDGDLASRLVSIDYDILRSRPVYAVCGGVEKSRALRVVLKSGLLQGLIVTSNLAKLVL
jgi:DNA-binding transcriptional regulator LsrR (DeoR family)